MKENFLKNLYPTTKIVISLCLFLSAIVIGNSIYSYSIAIICGIIALFHNKLSLYIKRIVLSLGILIVSIFIIQSIFIKSEEVLFSVGFINIYKNGVIKAINLTSKLTAFVSSLTIMILTTSIKDFTVALEKKGINSKVVFVILLSLQMIAEVRKQAVVILDSQKSRGVETEGNVFVRLKALIPVFIPLVLSSIVNTEEKAITLESRGFSIGEKRTLLYDINETKKDKIIQIIMIIFLVICIIGRILWVISH